MVVFVSNIKRLRLVKEHGRDDVLNGIVVKHNPVVVEFGDAGRYETDDKSEIEWLRNHLANSHNPKHTSVKFWELDFKEGDYKPRAEKVAAKAST